MTELERIKIQFEEFKELKEPERTKKLAMLMTKIEQYYDIPLFGFEKTEKNTSSEEFKLYIEISMQEICKEVRFKNI